jgi:hypothetical protein
VTEQPENQPETGAPAWVPSDPEKAEPAAGGEPTPVQPPVDPATQVSVPEPAPAETPAPEPVAPAEAPAPEPAALAETPAPEPVAPVPPPPVTPEIQSVGASTTAPPDDRPEIAVGAAFAGGLAVAVILKRLAR